MFIPLKGPWSWCRAILPAALILAATPPAAGNGAPDAAGIVAYTRIQGSTYVLLAEHVDSNRGWGAFGGNRKGEETGAATASREFREETRCVYEGPSAEELAGNPSVVVGKFLSYVAEVPYVPAQVFESNPAPPDCRGPDFDERGPWIWIPLADLVWTLENPDSTAGYRLPDRFVPDGCKAKLWDASATVLKKALAEGYLPE